MKRLNNIIAVVFLAGFIVYVMANLLHAPYEKSEKENRYLAQFPEFSFSKIIDGSFMTEFEQYAADQYRWRDSAVSLKATVEKILGKRINNGVYFGKDDYLIARPSPFDAEKINKGLADLLYLAGTTKYNVSFAVIPTAFEIKQDKLPPFAYEDSEQDIIEYAHNAVFGKDIVVCDVGGYLAEHKDEYIFYRTDHHQTALGSYYIYEKLAEVLGFQSYPITDFNREILSDGFYGSSWAKASINGIEPDILEKFTHWSNMNFHANYPLEDRERDGLYDYSLVDSSEPYAVYLGGNHPLIEISSEANTGRKLAIIGDSHARSVIPFLANHYDEIDMFDLRYYTGSVEGYMDQNGISELLVMYSTETLTTYGN